jgi:hypothetical protein
LAVVLGVLLGGCVVPIGRFTAIGDPAGADDATPPARIHGETCHWWIFGITFGIPRVEDAVADALARAGTTGVLRDVELVSVHPVYGPLGKHCYVIAGTLADAELRQ